MRIEHFISGYHCLDGGTNFWTVRLADGSTLKIGQDGRTFPQHQTHGLLFLGNLHPDHGNVRFLEKGSQEEKDLLAATSDYLDRTCDRSWRASVNDPERRSRFAKGDESIELALQFLSAIHRGNELAKFARAG